MNLKINNNRALKFRILTFAIISSLLFSACELFLNEAAECIVKVKPNLPDKTFITGKLGVEFSDNIKASALNHVKDDDFAYYFDFIGRPPLGINYYVENRTIYFQGVPTEKGVFSFVIKLTIGDGALLDDDGICFNKDATQKKYVITVE